MTNIPLKKNKILILKRYTDIVLPAKSYLASFCQTKRAGSIRSWSRTLRFLYKNQCVITGYQENELYMCAPELVRAKLHAHHLYNTNNYKNLQNHFLNGIPILESFHKDFHRMYGHEVTPQDFVNYLNYLKSQPCDVKGFYINSNIDQLIYWVQWLDSLLVEN
jgi:hypothetical protein